MSVGTEQIDVVVSPAKALLSPEELLTSLRESWGGRLIVEPEKHGHLREEVKEGGKEGLAGEGGDKGLVEQEKPRKKRVFLEYIEDSEWETLGTRGAVAKLLFAGGSKAKAYRYVNCYRYAVPKNCPENPDHRYFQRCFCGLRFCQYDAPALYGQLFARYASRFVPFVRGESMLLGKVTEKRPSPRSVKVNPDVIWARVNFSVRSDGSPLTSERIQWFNQRIRSVMRQKEIAGGSEYGILWVDEVGYETRGRRAHRKAGGLNLHAHGIYYGPRLDWHKLHDAWVHVTGGDGLGVWLTFIKGWRKTPEREIRRALAHMLKYVSKIPAETPERIAALEIAFDGVRRVHAGGIFYALVPPDDDLHQLRADDPGDCCPECPDHPRFYYNSRPWEIFSVECLIAEGRRDLEEVRREVGRKRVFGEGGSP